MFIPSSTLPKLHVTESTVVGSLLEVYRVFVSGKFRFRYHLLATDITSVLLQLWD